MLRVSPDGKEVWVQSGNADTNVVLNAEDLTTLATLVTGKGPVTNSWTNDGKYSVVTNSGDTYATVFDAKSYKEMARLAVGQKASNISFAKDGTGFMAVGGANAVAVIDMAKFSVVDQLRAGTNPQGLIIF
jgi:DNA-binding beta-propeller fold protein YncE